MESNTSRAEAERLLGISEKLLQSRDLNGSRDFAVLAQETEPLLDGSDQILAVVDVLLAAERRVNNHHDWYSILQSDTRSSDADLIKRNYRRLALLLHPDKNHFPFADHAFRLVSQAWAVLSDPNKKPLYDNELSLFSSVDLPPSAANNPKLPVRRTPPTAPVPAQGARLQSFWTVCPYCYVMYEYPRVYEECCLKCERCKRGFHATPVPAMPPMVPGQEAYYCCWAFFPLGFVTGKTVGAGAGAGVAAMAPAAPGFPNWMPPMFDGAQSGGAKQGKAKVAATAPLTVPAPKKRGRPRLH